MYMCNDDWILFFPKAKVYLSRMSSDHCLIWLSYFLNAIFLELILLYASTECGCSMKVMMIWYLRLGWLFYGDILSKSHGLATALKLWNKETFGNVFLSRKKILLAIINDIQKALYLHHCPFLINLEVDIQKEYQGLRDREATYWKQKSREMDQRWGYKYKIFPFNHHM